MCVANTLLDTREAISPSPSPIASRVLSCQFHDRPGANAGYWPNQARLAGLIRPASYLSRRNAMMPH